MFVSGDRANFANGQLITDFARDELLPGAYSYRETVDAGGLLSYGVNLPDLSAGYVDKILIDTSPADLPVQPPTKYELVEHAAENASGVVATARGYVGIGR